MKRLPWVFVALGIGAALTWLHRTTVFLWLLAPAQGQLSAGGQPIFTSPTEMLGLTIRVSILGGAIVAFPVLVYNVYRLLSPILNKKQKRFIFLFVPIGLLFYVAGTAFAYFVLLPTGLGFLLTFGAGVATPMIRITEYLDMALAMLFWLGIIFELPLVMLLLTKLEVVSYTRLRSLRRYVPFTALLLAALITPTFDGVNQILVALPIVALYEVGLLLARLARPKGTG